MDECKFMVQKPKIKCIFNDSDDELITLDTMLKTQEQRMKSGASSKLQIEMVTDDSTDSSPSDDDSKFYTLKTVQVAWEG